MLEHLTYIFKALIISSFFSSRKILAYVQTVTQLEQLRDIYPGQKQTRKLVTYSILIIRDKRFNIINKTEDQLSGKTFSVLMRDENSKFHYDEYLVKSQNIWKIHISKIITLDELYSYNFSENENIILLRSKDKYNIKLIRNLLKKNYLHRTYLMI